MPVLYVSSSWKSIGRSMPTRHITSPATFTSSPNANVRNALVEKNSHAVLMSAAANNIVVSGYAHGSSIQNPKIMPAISIVPINMSTSSMAKLVPM